MNLKELKKEIKFLCTGKGCEAINSMLEKTSCPERRKLLNKEWELARKAGKD